MAEHINIRSDKCHKCSENVQCSTVISSPVQTALAICAVVPTQPTPSSIHLAPLRAPSLQSQLSSSQLLQLVSSLNFCMQLKWTVGRSQHSVYRLMRAKTWPYLSLIPRSFIKKKETAWQRIWFTSQQIVAWLNIVCVAFWIHVVHVQFNE